MSVKKKYAIVSFDNDSQVEVVPSSWLDEYNTAVKWPNNYSQNTIMKFIKGCKSAEDDWQIIPVKVLGFANTFSRANHEATIAQDTSNIGTDSSNSAVKVISRKRTRPIRKSSDNSEIDTDREASEKKVFDIPKFTPSLKVSLVNGKSVYQSPGFEEKTMFAMFTPVFKCLGNIQKDLKILKAEQNNIQCQLSEIINKEEPTRKIFTIPTGVSIPVETDEELLKLNVYLKEDKTLTPALARYLYEVSIGKTISAFMLNITKRVLSKSVASQYSRLGRKGKKSFEVVNEVYSAILTAAALKFEDTRREDLADKFGRVLASACDWNGTRTETIYEFP